MTFSACDEPTKQNRRYFLAAHTAFQIAAAVRDLNGLQAALRDGSYDLNEVKAPSLTAMSLSRAKPGRPECPETTKLVRAALLQWSPERHSLFPPPTRAAARLVLHIYVSLRVRSFDGPSQAAILQLPLEIWLKVLGYVGRVGFTYQAALEACL